MADLKTRRSRFDRVAGEVKLTPGQQLDINEFMHPRIEEIADTLPAGLGRWLLATRWARACVEPFTRRGPGREDQLACAATCCCTVVASMRGMRRKSLRFQTEHQRMRQWLADDPAPVGRPSRAGAGSGARRSGWSRATAIPTRAAGRNFQRLMDALPRLQSAPDGAQQLHDLSQAALADDGGAALEALLVSLRIDGTQASV